MSTFFFLLNKLKKFTYRTSSTVNSAGLKLCGVGKIY